MFKSDQPIKSCSEDILGRTSFAKEFASRILNSSSSESLVLGLFGSWGMGKTSLINMTCEQIDSIAASNAQRAKPIIIFFNPWNYSDQHQLISQFFKTLSVGLKKSDYAQQAQEAGEKLESYAELFKPLSVMSAITPWTLLLSSIPFVMGSVASAAKKWGEARGKDLESARKELNKLLSEQPHKVIIIIDDIDRLNNTEIRQVFQLVKSLGDFPNTIYMLAFDRNVVVNALKDVQGGDGSDYLDKIVQVPIHIPTAPKDKLLSYLLDRLQNDFVNKLTNNELNKEYWWKIYPLMIPFFETLRDANRYLNALSFGYETIKDEVNPVDYFAITTLQVFVPSVYERIRENKDLFAGAGKSAYGMKEEEQKQLKARYEEILSRTSESAKTNVIELVEGLFPKMTSAYGYTGGHGTSELSEWRRYSHICSPDVFDVYFRLALPKDEISRKEIEMILSAASSADAFRETVLQLNRDNRIRRFLERMGDYTKADVPKTNILAIISVLMDVGDLFPEDDNKSFLGYDTPMMLLRIIWQLLMIPDSQEERAEIIKKAIENANQSVYTLVHVVAVLGQEYGKFEAKKDAKPEAECTVNAKQLAEIEALMCSKIEAWAKAGRLQKSFRFRITLYSWKEWAGAEKTKRYISDITAADEGLIAFLTAFLLKSTSIPLDTGIRKTHWKIDLKELAEWIEIKDIEKRIRGIFTSGKRDNLTEQNNLAINVFLDTVDGKSKKEDW